jgi:hypothetical protein
MVVHRSLHEQRLRLLDEQHEEHEDIIRFLQDHPDPQNVPFLRQAIALKPRLAYLEYDDYGSYYKKCLWALKAIGTPEAIAVIQECTASDNAALKEQALYRLSKMRTETG